MSNAFQFLGGGGGGGASDAYDVAYTTSADPSITNVGQALDTIFYVPTDVTSMSGGGVYEIGSTVTEVNLTWTINKAITSQSLNQSIGALDPSLRAYTVPGPHTTNKTFILTASDGQTTDQGSTALTFMPKRYYGVYTETTIDEALILELPQEFASNRNKAITYDCTGGRYPYFIYPTSFGALTSVTVGGLAFSDFTQTVVSLTNESGYTQNYYVTRFNGIQTGAAINVVWG